MTKNRGLSDSYKEKIGISILDKLDKFPDLFLKGGLIWMGSDGGKDWLGAVRALIFYEFGRSGNLVAGGVGVGFISWLITQYALGKLPSIGEFAAGMPVPPYVAAPGEEDWYPFRKRPS